MLVQARGVERLELQFNLISSRAIDPNDTLQYILQVIIAWCILFTVSYAVYICSVLVHTSIAGDVELESTTVLERTVKVHSELSVLHGHSTEAAPSRAPALQRTLPNRYY